MRTPKAATAASTARGKRRASSSTPFDSRMQMVSDFVCRLQYAKIKVENGWHTLSLDQVENLYFHTFRAQAELRDEYTRRHEMATTVEDARTIPLDFAALELDLDDLLERHRRGDAGQVLYGSGSEEESEDYDMATSPEEHAPPVSQKVLGKRKAVDQAGDHPSRRRASSSASRSPSASLGTPRAATRTPKSNPTPGHLGSTTPLAPTYGDFWEGLRRGPLSTTKSPDRPPLPVSPGKRTSPTTTFPAVAALSSNPPIHLSTSSPSRPSDEGRSLAVVSPFLSTFLGGTMQDRTLLGTTGSTTALLGASTGALSSSSQTSCGGGGGALSSQSSSTTASRQTSSSTTFSGKPLGSQASFSALDPPPPLPFDLFDDERIAGPGMNVSHERAKGREGERERTAEFEDAEIEVSVARTTRDDWEDLEELEATQKHDDEEAEAEWKEGHVQEESQDAQDIEIQSLQELDELWPSQPPSSQRC